MGDFAQDLIGAAEAVRADGYFYQLGFAAFGAKDTEFRRVLGVYLKLSAAGIAIIGWHIVSCYSSRVTLRVIILIWKREVKIWPGTGPKSNRKSLSTHPMGTRFHCINRVKNKSSVNERGSGETKPSQIRVKTIVLFSRCPGDYLLT
jgi:hypothetical protein